MRNILFRGKRSDNGEWIEGYYAKVADCLTEKPIDLIFNLDGLLFPHNEIGGCNEIESETIGRYTGLVDKNGVKIFEGDVVKTKFGRLCVVLQFSSRAYCGWDLRPVDTVDNILHTKAPTTYDLWEDKNLEVVGNIHDNPEFRKVAI